MTAKRRSIRHGLSLLELLAVLAIVATFLAVSLPAFANLRARSSLRAAAAELQTHLRQLRARAVSENRDLGWHFRPAEAGYVADLVRDGDGDGIRTADLARGIDELVESGRHLLPLDSSCRIGFPPGGVPDPSRPSRRLRPGMDPIRFGTSDIVSFSPLGESTPGSLFVSEPGGRTICIRIHGNAGRAHTLIYDPAIGRWE